MTSPLSPVYRSAACIIPPPHLWPRIQAIRALNDKGYVRWPPHINMLYGFIPDDPLGRNFESAASSLAASLEGIRPFWVRLAALGTFDHGGKSRTLWLHPQPQKGREGAVHELQSAMAAVFPHCNEVGSISPRGFRPHLSVGQWGGHGAASRARAALQASWNKDGPLDFLVDRVCFISRAGFTDPFVLRAEIALGSDTGAAGAFRMTAPEPAVAATVPRPLAPAGAVAEGETAACTDDSTLPAAGGCGSVAGGGGAVRALTLPAAATGPAASDIAFVAAPLVLPAAPTTVPGGRAQVGAAKPSHTPMSTLLQPAPAARRDAPAAAVTLAAVASVASAVAGAASHGAAAAAPSAAHTAGAGAAAAPSVAKLPASMTRARPGGPQLMLSPLPPAEGSGGVCGPAPASVAFSEPAPEDLEPDVDTSTGVGMPAARDAAAAAGASERKGKGKGKPKRQGKADAVGGAGAACAGAGGAAASSSAILSEASLSSTAAGTEPEAADE